MVYYVCKGLSWVASPAVRSKSDIRHIIEVLCQVLCHNISVTSRAMHEVGYGMRGGAMVCSRPIWFHLMGLVLASVIPILLFGIIVAVLFERQHRASLERSPRDTARALIGPVDHELISSLFITLQALVTSGAMLISSSASFSGCTARRSMRA